MAKACNPQPVEPQDEQEAFRKLFENAQAAPGVDISEWTCQPSNEPDDWRVPYADASVTWGIDGQPDVVKPNSVYACTSACLEGSHLSLRSQHPGQY